jgi:hypothetical protein
MLRGFMSFMSHSIRSVLFYPTAVEGHIDPVVDYLQRKIAEFGDLRGAYIRIIYVKIALFVNGSMATKQALMASS